MHHETSASVTNYERFPDAFQFIKDVAVDLEETRIIAAEPWDYIIIACKGRSGNNWFLGAITDELDRQFIVDLEFLDDNVNYNATIYSDGEDAHRKNNPMAYQIESKSVDNKSKLEIKLVPGGGTAISFMAYN